MDTTLYGLLMGKIKSAISNISDNIASKLDKNQGVENSGKITGINEAGDVVPMLAPGITYNEETQCLEFRNDANLNLDTGIQLDNTLEQSGYAADSKVVGEKIKNLQEQINTLSSSVATNEEAKEYFEM